MPSAVCSADKRPVSPSPVSAVILKQPCPASIFHRALTPSSAAMQISASAGHSPFLLLFIGHDHRVFILKRPVPAHDHLIHAA